MIDWATYAQVATAAGTLVLAIATFSSIKSANHSARVAERSLLAAQRPILTPSRPEDPEERARFGDGHVIRLHGSGGVIDFVDGRLYMAIALRNGGAGLAVIHGWHVRAMGERLGEVGPPEVDAFRRQLRDLYIPAQQTGFWQAAIRDTKDPDYELVRGVATNAERLIVDLLYGDHEGGQRSIVRVGISTGDFPDNRELGYARAEVLRYWNVDSHDPR
jgi:hypothetical protein